ncbi:MAG TPA: CBS domain-containing protein [Thermoprotei archaeon]|nr:CBS domain-containing protein [Thermoprotei archaeon]
MPRRHCSETEVFIIPIQNILLDQYIYLSILEKSSYSLYRYGWVAPHTNYLVRCLSISEYYILVYYYIYGMSEKLDLGLNEINRKLYAYISQIMGIRAYDIMEPAISISPDLSITMVAKTMDESGSGAVVIVDSDRNIKGIITFKDITTRVVARELDPNKVRAGDIMTENVYYVPAEATLDQIAAVMLKYGVRRVPVVNKFGRLVGMVSSRDLIGFLGMQRELMARLITSLENELKKHAEELAKKRDEETGLYG